ncbi:alpha/beta fold hydrolase [Sphingobium boeckii]|uniref:Pimeloyl-ACP methyl ester carboxylesterase n=1 Tax=Sphingobium boeckii TaxID=1082345 RepID=A0A7W9EEH3_9SPHN|nr:alpha/beta hydrolase [Sphingobium boeckii]MBB5684995.1 pimeloyl-ACP methyl ester carboxylesterase [Sphingobium boeckii]
MIDRRTFSLGAMAAAAVCTHGAAAQVAFSEPAKGPWTSSGLLQRAGGVLHYVTLGDPASTRPPVVLLHKLGGWVADWRFVAPALAEGRRVIAFDLPGHGDSRWLGNAPYIQSLSETAALLVGALDEMGISQIDLIGTSLGGCVSVPLTAFFPDRVRSLTLVSCALPRAHTLAEIATLIDEPEKAIFTPQGDPLPVDASISAKMMGLIHAGPIAAEQNASRRRAGRWIQPSERGVLITDIKHLLTRISAPTLLLYGDQPNAYLTFRAGAEGALKNAQTRFVPDSGAFVMQDNPSATAAVLKSFLDTG